MKVSIIIPYHNEEGNLKKLFPEIAQVLANKKYEIIFVNDGSSDDSEKEISQIKNDNVVKISLRKRFGKGKALKTGFETSTGDIIVFMDADLQDNPKDLINFLKKIDEGYDLVNGYRATRHDGLKKTLPSKIFNWMLIKIFRSKFHDINCGFKVMRREILEEIPLYGDNYRFLPLLAEKEGFRVSEVVVDHRARTRGRSKYGFLRLFFGLADTFTTYFIYRFSEKPLHFFGPIGMIIFLIGLGISIELTIERIFYNELLYRRPILTLAVLLIIIGMQIVMTGVVAELIVYLRQRADITKRVR